MRDWTMGISGGTAILFGWIKSIFAAADWEFTLSLSSQIIGTVAGGTVAILTAYSKYLEIKAKKEFYKREREQDIEKHNAEMEKLKGIIS